MTHLRGFLAAGLLCLAAFPAASQEEVAPRPNIVMMITDDQRYDAMGAVQRQQGSAGLYPWFANATPNMDRIGAEGVRFTNAFVVSSLCSPSRAAYLTGRYNHENGVATNHTPLPLDSVTYAGVLSAQGYRTGHFGKWHMGSQSARPGFHEWAGFNGQGVYNGGTFNVNGSSVKTSGWVDDVSTDYAIDFIRRRAAADGPFAMMLGFKSPHTPTTPAARHRNLFPNATLRKPANSHDYAPFDTTPELRANRLCILATGARWWASTRMSAGCWPRSARLGSRTTPLSCSRAITGSSSASTGSPGGLVPTTGTNGTPTKSRCGSR